MTSWYICSIRMSGRPVDRGFLVVQRLVRAEELLRAPDPGREGVHLVRGVVDRERRARGRGDTELPVQRPRAVMPDPDRDALVVEDLPEVVGVDAVDDERHCATAVLGGGRSDDPDSRDTPEQFE